MGSRLRPQVEDQLVIPELQEMGLHVWHMPAPSEVSIIQSFPSDPGLISSKEPSTGLDAELPWPADLGLCALLAQLELSPRACVKAGQTKLTSPSPKNPPPVAFQGAGATLLGLSPHPRPPGGLWRPQGLTRVADPANCVLANCVTQLSAGEVSPRCCSLLGTYVG